MAAYDDIYEVAADNHGLIRSAQAKGLGMSGDGSSSCMRCAFSRGAVEDLRAHLSAT